MAAEERLKGVGIRARRLDVACRRSTRRSWRRRAPAPRFLAGIAVEAPAAPCAATRRSSRTRAAAHGARPAGAAARGAGAVPWEEIERMYADGVRTFVEVEPGSVLTNLVGDILSGRPHRAVALDSQAQARRDEPARGGARGSPWPGCRWTRGSCGKASRHAETIRGRCRSRSWRFGIKAQLRQAVPA